MDETQACFPRINVSHDSHVYIAHLTRVNVFATHLG